MNWSIIIIITIIRAVAIIARIRKWFIKKEIKNYTLEKGFSRILFRLIK